MSRTVPSISPWRRRWCRLGTTVQIGVLFGVLVHAASSAVPAAAQGASGDGSRKYAVMAAFLYNFLLYVEWPDSEALADGPIRIGILGSNPFGDALEAMEMKAVQGRSIVVQVFEDPEGVQPTHILFISDTHAGQVEAVCRNLRGQAVLTVGESEDFTRRGGVIRFFETSGSQRLSVEINQTAAEASRFKIRSKLMRLASVVTYPIPPGEGTETNP